MIDTIDFGYQKLMEAVALQAAADLRKCYESGGKCRDAYSDGMMYAEDIEDFFLSDSFFKMYNIDGSYIVDQLRKECRYGKKEYNS